LTSRAALEALRTRLEIVVEERRHRIAADARPGLLRPGPEELDRRTRDLADYTLELESILGELLALLTDSAPAG